MEFIYCCPQCSSVFGVSDENGKKCPDCHCDTILMGTDTDWYAIPSEKREEIKHTLRDSDSEKLGKLRSPDYDRRKEGVTGEKSDFILAGAIACIAAGAGSAIYGNHLNNDLDAQLEAIWNNGTKNPGDLWLILGGIVAVIGLVLLVSKLIQRK